MEVPPLFTRIAHLLSCLLVVSGFATLIAQTPGTPYVFEMPGITERLGADLVFVSDINGNGSDDVVVGAPGGITQAVPIGRLRAVDGLTGQQLWTGQGGVNQGNFGKVVTATPDLDGDGIADVVTSGRGFVTGSATLFWRSGATGVPLGQLTLAATTLSSRVPTVIPWRDWNNDGVVDYAVAGVYGAANQPIVAVVDRLTGILTTANLPLNTPLLSGDLLPDSLLGSEDLNGDGIVDLVVGSPTSGTAGLTGRGSVQALDGSNLQSLWFVQGTQIRGGLGASLISAPDVDADGVREIIAGQPSDILLPPTSPGSFRIFSGANGSALYDLLTPNLNFTSLGSTITFEGTVGSLGTESFLAAALPTNLGPNAAGPVILRFLVGPVIFQPLGGQVRNIAAAFVPNAARPALAAGGDLNGDGVGDVALGINGGAQRSSVHFFPTLGAVSFSPPNPINQTLTLLPTGPSGQQSWSISLFGPPIAAGTPALFVAGTQSAVIPVLATNLLIDVTAPFVTIPVIPAVPGPLTLDFSVPGSPVPLISSFTFYLQAFSFDPLAPQGLVSSNGLHITF